MQEVKELAHLVRRVYGLLDVLRLEHPLARAIKFPQLPPALTESLVVHLLRTGTILPELREAYLTLGRGADIIAKKGEVVVRIEVKATAQKGFQRLSGKDVAADYLVWVHCGRYFAVEEDMPLTVFVIPRPGMYYRAKEEVWASQVPDKVGAALRTFQISLGHITGGA